MLIVSGGRNVEKYRLRVRNLTGWLKVYETTKIISFVFRKQWKGRAIVLLQYIYIIHTKHYILNSLINIQNLILISN